MIYYKVVHRYKLIDHFECKDIGIYSSLANAEKAMTLLRDKSGFKETANGFKIKKQIRLFKPKLLDRTFWIDGFDTYTY
jgi:hypothetical protein